MRQHLDAMSVKVSAVSEKTGLTTVVTRGFTTQQPVTELNKTPPEPPFSLLSVAMVTNSTMSANPGTTVSFEFLYLIIIFSGMRPNGFPIHFHGGKGTESVCHFCCNPASADGPYCNRRLLDKQSHDAGLASSINQIYADGNGVWADINGGLTQSLRADNDGLAVNNSPARGGWNTDANWLKDSRFHGMWRNPETQVLHNLDNSRYARPSG